MRFGSVCSGIEAASTAWEPLGWEAAWFSEIEPFPCAVLKHRYPHVPNHGDMTTLPARILAGEVEAPDVLVGGTPCQSFSVAGLRQGLKDPRGQLTRTYVEICDAIDTVRAAAGKPPVVLVWENVPGVLSDRDNAFGNFLGALSGEDGPLEPPGGKWTNAGLVCGPARDLAWRVLDAQYFGVAQRRRRVFLVGHSRAGSLRPVKVLLVEQGVQRHSAPSREAGQRAAPTLAARTRGGGGLGTDFDLDGGLIRHDGGRGGVAYGFDATGSTSDVGEELHPVLRGVAVGNAGHHTGVAHVVAPPQTDGGRGVAYSIQAGATRTNPNSGPNGMGVQIDHAYTIEARSEVQCVAHVVAPPQTEYPEVAEVCGTISDGAHNGGGLNGQDAYTGRVLPVVPYDLFQITAPINRQNRDENSPCHTLARDNAAHAAVVSARPFAFAQNTRDEVRLMNGDGSIVGALAAESGMHQTCYVAAPAMAVRRLLPVECERLQGFPDEYTRIPWKGKPASECPDGPRYKALGNSMAVPCMYWIGWQIRKAMT